ncbi:MAG: hybrid sensor histidine kinase/response regulator [Desulfobacterales bacterium]|nr:hybrid sensor histidine kinase/response regulator [Desulfobacterales bacterium]
MSEKGESKGKVLIVDDSIKNIQVLGTILRQGNYIIHVAQDGAQALKKVENVDIDLILLDVMMPVMDGFETCKKLKESPDFRDIPVIFLTARTEADDIVKGFELGAVDYVTKPFKSVELLARVATHLELKHSRETIIEKSSLLKQLVHVLCHDLSNPFGTARALLKLIIDNRSRFDALMPDILISVENGLSVIDLVREMRALEEGKIDLLLDDYELNYMIEMSQTILERKISEKNITIKVNVDENLKVLVDQPSFVNSVLNNILTNAVKFSFPGSEIQVNAVREGDFVTISVRDYGIGMPEKLKNDLFELDVSTSRTGTAGETGTGFGMPLMKNFVDAYGGSIEIFSKKKTEDSEDHGTEIKLILKAA